VPEAQASPFAQIVPQTPQFCGSVLVSTQELPHCVSGGWHMGGVTHFRLWQTWPVLQQMPLQSTWPTGQVFTQLPVAHDWFAAQVRLQPPQFCGSRFVSTQTPLQLVKPAVQPVMQLPWLQKVPDAQGWLQLPQLLLSCDGSMQMPLHSSWPEGQPQLPCWQLWPVPQAWPHDPQLRASVFVLTQAFEQLVSLLAQPDWHSDPLHTGVGA
jgi:hypothetical protein